MRFIAVFLTVLGAAIPVQSETVRISKKDCSYLVEHRARADVAYKPGVDVRGRKVVPVGGPESRTYDNLVPEVLEFPIALNPLNGGAARFGETSLQVGVVKFDLKKNRATFNGQPLSRSDTQKLSRRCQEILREEK